MEPYIKEFEEIFVNALTPVEVAIFFSPSEEDNYFCLFSNSKKYKGQKQYPLYDLSPLMRTLCEKSHIVSQTLLDELYEGNNSDEICFILDWNDHMRKVIIFDLSKIELFEQDEFVEQLKNEKERMREIYQKIFFKYKKSKLVG